MSEIDKIIKYAGTNLSSRRGSRGGEVRSEVEKEVDFIEMVKMRQNGYTFDQITEYFNESRDYFTTTAQNKNLFHKRMADVNTRIEADDLAKEHFADILEEVDWIYRQVINKWMQLKDVQHQTIEQGMAKHFNKELKSGDSEDADEDELSQALANNPAGSKGKFVTKKTGINEQHQAKYLDIAVKVLELRAKLTGAGKMDKKDDSLIEMVKNLVLDGGGKAKGPLITSEDQLLQIYASDVTEGADFDFIENVPDTQYYTEDGSEEE